MELIRSDIIEQIEIIFQNISNILKILNSNIDKTLFATIYLKDMKNQKYIEEKFLTYFKNQV